MDYSPFDDRLHMIAHAIRDAIAWEESRLDAGCDPTPEEEQETRQKIKRYEEFLARNKFKTRRQNFLDDTKDMKLVTFAELMNPKGADHE
jgi:hypothetical protein